MRATLNGPCVVIPPILLPDGSLSLDRSADLTEYQGRIARVYVGADGQIFVNPDADSYWQVAEASLPPAVTEQVQIGTRQDFATQVATVLRGTGPTDAVSLTENQFIGEVGFPWAPFRLGEDYTVSPAGVVWVEGGRAPAAGADYLVEVVTASTVPITEARALPLDLAQHAVTLFDLPQTGA